MAEDLLPSDPKWAGPYRLLGRLGAGGMGQVYLARSPGGRLVAVKVIRPELAADHGFRARFAREAAAARTVSGIFTASVIDADTEAPQPWLATAYIPGPSLTEAVARGGPLPPAVVATLGAGLAEGLQAIHAAGLVHRDLKPSNVLLADDGPRVIDFGIARAADASMLTQTGTIVGSPGFLSPEQATGQAVGPAGDVFSLGSVLTFAASGEGPFGEGTVASLVYRVVNAEPNLSGVPGQLRPLIQRCLAKDPASRPTAGELLASLGAMPQTQEWIPGTDFSAARPDTVIAPGAAEAHSAPTRTHVTPVPAPPPGGITPPGPVGSGQAPYGHAGNGHAPYGQAPYGQAASGQAGDGPAKRARGPRWALIAAVVAVIAAASAGVALATDGSGSTTAGPSVSARSSAKPSPVTARSPARPSAGSSAPVTTPVTTPRASPTASRRRAATAAPSEAAGAAVAGVWTGTYTCNQGLTGVRLTITPVGGGALRALAAFYPVAGNPGTASGSYELSGSYSAASGLILTPAYWISEPPNYVMVSLSAPPPSGKSMRGTVEGPNCTTFSVTR